MLQLEAPPPSHPHPPLPLASGASDGVRGVLALLSESEMTRFSEFLDDCPPALLDQISKSRSSSFADIHIHHPATVPADDHNHDAGQNDDDAVHHDHHQQQCLHDHVSSFALPSSNAVDMLHGSVWSSPTLAPPQPQCSNSDAQVIPSLSLMPRSFASASSDFGRDTLTNNVASSPSTSATYFDASYWTSERCAISDGSVASLPLETTTMDTSATAHGTISPSFRQCNDVNADAIDQHDFRCDPVRLSSSPSPSAQSPLVNAQSAAQTDAFAPLPHQHHYQQHQYQRHHINHYEQQRQYSDRNADSDTLFNGLSATSDVAFENYYSSRHHDGHQQQHLVLQLSHSNDDSNSYYPQQRYSQGHHNYNRTAFGLSTPPRASRNDSDPMRFISIQYQRPPMVVQSDGGSASHDHHCSVSSTYPTAMPTTMPTAPTRSASANDTTTPLHAPALLTPTPVSTSVAAVPTISSRQPNAQTQTQAPQSIGTRTRAFRTRSATAAASTRSATTTAVTTMSLTSTQAMYPTRELVHSDIGINRSSEWMATTDSSSNSSSSITPTATVSSSLSFPAHIELATTLSDCYWKNGRKNLQCFPSCPEHNDFYSMKMSNRKHASVGVCRGPIYCHVITPDAAVSIATTTLQRSRWSSSGSRNDAAPPALPAPPTEQHMKYAHGVGASSSGGSARELFVLGRFERVPQRDANATSLVRELSQPPAFATSAAFEAFRYSCFQAVEMNERRVSTNVADRAEVEDSSASERETATSMVRSTWFFLPDVWKVQPMLKKKRKATRSAPAQTFPFCFRVFVYTAAEFGRPSGFVCVAAAASSFFELYSTRTVDRVKRRYWTSSISSSTSNSSANGRDNGGGASTKKHTRRH